MKIGYFITARLKSSRLKQKILLDLNGKTILDHVIERCKKVYGIDGIVLCTSTNEQDSVLYDFALKHQIQFYPGSEEDVLLRLLNAAEYYGYDGFLSITADNPLHSFYIARQILEVNREHYPDFIFTHGLPLGLAPYFIETKALKVAVEMKKESNTEIWGPFVNRPDFFNIVYLNVTGNLFNDKTRLTCDYPEDYRFLSHLLSGTIKNTHPDIFDLVYLIQVDPELITINNEVIQQSPSPKEIERINHKFNELKNEGEVLAKSIGKKLTPQKKTIKLSL